MTIEERFWIKVNKDGPLWDGTNCWEWTGSKVRGYGDFWLGTVNGLAHRYSYKTLVGPIPEGLQIDHLCRNRPCVNPAHLEPVTASVNNRRGIGPELLRKRMAAFTHCPKGHGYTPENTYTSKKNCRDCRACKRIRNKQRPSRAMMRP